jgi:hypothetical protein
MFKIIHNVETGEITTVELAGDELTEFIANETAAKAAAKKASKELADELSARATEKAALLTRLGLTENELKTILG